MNIKVNPKYASQQAEITNIFLNFKNNGTLLGKGDRNQIKFFSWNEKILNVKAFKIPNLINTLAYKYFRKSKAKRSFENANYLLSHGIGTPEPVAFAENFSLLGLKDSYYASVHLECDLTFRELISIPNYPDKETILKEFTRFTYKLHENRILFKDHSPGNTLIKNKKGVYQFYLVDLNRMDFKSLSIKERITNFSHLTPKREMVKTMSEEYAKLIGLDFEMVYKLMWNANTAFQNQYYRKKKIKETLLFWK